MIATSYILSIINIAILVRLFSKFPFRISQFFYANMIYAFCVRPIFVALCDRFTPFYFFEQSMYDYGIFISNIILLIFGVTLILFSKHVNKTVSIEINNLKLVIYVTLIFSLATTIAAIFIYGTSILPGFRSSGLQLSASGSQIFFALASIFTMIGVSACFILLGFSLDRKTNILWPMVFIFLFFIISMIFYQRGPFIIGAISGLTIASMANKNFIKKNWRKLVTPIAVIMLVAIVGRPLISYITQSSVGQFQADAYGSNYGWSNTGACMIANSGNQEHDQVWPIIILHKSQHEFNFFDSIQSAIFRPFLSLESRISSGKTTSVDSLNLANDYNTFLSYNFGFSITFIQYHYYLFGYFSIFSIIIFTFIAANIENKLYYSRIGLDEIIKITLLLGTVQLSLSAIDEQFRWFITLLPVCFLVWLCCKLMNALLALKHGRR
jgi:hypothetical protein